MILFEQANPLWEEKYSSGLAQYYPWDAVVSFIYHYAPKNKPRHQIKILEVGCGSGPNLWFAAREGFNVTGIDGSNSAIKIVKSRFQSEGLTGEFKVVNFSEDLPFESNNFDLVIDRAAITYCGEKISNKLISEIHRVLSPAGKFFFNPYSDKHGSFLCGENGHDGMTTKIRGGSVMNTGDILFYSKKEIIKKLESFKILRLSHLELADLKEANESIHAEWRVIVEK